MELKRIKTPKDIRVYEQGFADYLVSDIMPQCDLGDPLTEDELAYFQFGAYHNAITRLCSREVDQAHRYFVMLDGVMIGFVLCCTYHSEDGKCIILEMCIHAPYRSKGYGRACFALLQAAENAAYYELKTSSTRARRFWESLGFEVKGTNEDGSVMMALHPRA